MKWIVGKWERVLYEFFCVNIESGLLITLYFGSYPVELPMKQEVSVGKEILLEKKVNLYCFWEWEYLRRNKEYIADWEKYDHLYSASRILERDQELELYGLGKKLYKAAHGMAYRYNYRINNPDEGIPSDDLLSTVLSEGDNFQPINRIHTGVGALNRNGWIDPPPPVHQVNKQGIMVVKEFRRNENIYEWIGRKPDFTIKKNTPQLLISVDLNKNVELLMLELKYAYYKAKVDKIETLFEVKYDRIAKLFPEDLDPADFDELESGGDEERLKVLLQNEKLVKIKKLKDKLYTWNNENIRKASKNLWLAFLEYKEREAKIEKTGNIYNNEIRAYGLWLWDEYQKQKKTKGPDDKIKINVIRELGKKYSQSLMEDNLSSIHAIPSKYRRLLDRTVECVKVGRVLPMGNDPRKKKKVDTKK